MFTIVFTMIIQILETILLILKYPIEITVDTMLCAYAKSR